MNTEEIKYTAITIDKVMDMVNNPKPLEKPPYACPLSCYGEKDKCCYPNCFCQWHLNKLLL